MGFFWKFTRSGKISASYVSLILDVDPGSVDRTRYEWHTSFEELEMAMILLHDVEVLNQPLMGTTKKAFSAVVESLGYKPTLDYRQQREQLGLVFGKSVMGRHDGDPLDWGRFESFMTPITISLIGLDRAGFIRASDGHSRFSSYEDKLLCYRGHSDFVQEGEYYDLMPVHAVMKPFIEAMKRCDAERTETFVSEMLKWEKPEAIQCSTTCP